MTSLTLRITDAGRAAMVNAENTGTDPLVITAIALGSGLYETADDQTELQNEIKRLTTFGGQVVAADTIHVTVLDETSDAYSLGELGLITDTGALFAVYSGETAPILEKAASGMMVLSVDAVITSVDVQSLTFSGTGFMLPPGTETVPGILRLADNGEALQGADDQKAMTAKKTKAVIDAHRTEDAAHTWAQIDDKPAVVSQPHAEAGTVTTERRWTPQRVRQAILGWWNGSSAKTKLDGIATGATANATDAQLRARSSHTGTQAISTVSGLQGALDAKLNNNHASVTNSREWSASTVSQSEAEAGTSSTRRAWTAQRVRQAILGWWNNSSAKTKLDGIATGATANATDAQLRARSSHTGTQAISTVSNLQAALDSLVPRARTVNGKALTTDISLTPSDVGAAAASHSHGYADLPIGGRFSTGGNTIPRSDFVIHQSHANDGQYRSGSAAQNIDAVPGGDVGLWSLSNEGTFPEWGGSFAWIATQKIYTGSGRFQFGISYSNNSGKTPTPRMGYRLHANNFEAGYSDWVELWHTGNLNAFEDASGVYTAGSGALSNAVSNMLSANTNDQIRTSIGAGTGDGDAVIGTGGSQVRTNAQNDERYMQPGAFGLGSDGETINDITPNEYWAGMYRLGTASSPFGNHFNVGFGAGFGTRFSDTRWAGVHLDMGNRNNVSFLFSDTSANTVERRRAWHDGNLTFSLSGTTLTITDNS